MIRTERTCLSAMFVTSLILHQMLNTQEWSFAFTIAFYFALVVFAGATFVFIYASDD